MRVVRWALLCALVACGAQKGPVPAGPAATPPAPAPGNAKPIYPPDARRQGLEGVVTLEVRVRETGDVEKVTVLRGDEPFASAAVSAVERWRYVPARRDGQPVAVVAHQNVRFQLAHAMWRLLVSAAVQHGVTAWVGAGWFDTRSECQDAARTTPHPIGCQFSVRAQAATGDVMVVDPHGLTDLRREPAPRGWWAFVTAPWTTTGSFAQDVPVWQWRVLGTFLSKAACEQERQDFITKMQKSYPSSSGAFAQEARCTRS